MQFNDFIHVIPLQIRFSDVDRLDHVNNACYSNYFELGRVKYFDEVFRQHINWSEKGFVLARAEINYIEPVLLKDEIYCFTKVISMGNKSLTLKNSIVKKVNDEAIECANAIGILVAMDYVEKKSIELPEKWRELICVFDNIQ